MYHHVVLYFIKYILYCAFFTISMLVGIDKKINLEKNWNNFVLLLSKIDKNSQNLIKIWPKTGLIRSIALIFTSEKPCYLEIRVLGEPCKRSTLCRFKVWTGMKALQADSIIVGTRKLWRIFPIKQKFNITAAFFYSINVVKLVKFGDISTILHPP